MNILYLFGLIVGVHAQAEFGYWGVPTFVGQWGLPHAPEPVSPLASQGVFGVPEQRGQPWGGPEFGLWKNIIPLQSLQPIQPIQPAAPIIAAKPIAVRPANVENTRAQNVAHYDEHFNNFIGRPMGAYEAGKAPLGGEKYVDGLGIGKWTGPFAQIELTADGKFLKDTPEVEKAKAAHFAALEEEKKHQQDVNTAGTNSENLTGEYRGEGEAEGQYKEEATQNMVEADERRRMYYY